jgi:anti-anti-sigma factor
VDVEPCNLLTVAIEEPVPRMWVVRRRGELDMASAPMLGHVRRRLRDAPAPPYRVVLDLADLRFMTSYGVEALVRLQCSAAEVGAASLCVTGLRPAVARVLELTDGLGSFDVRHSVDSALAAGEPASR